MLLATSGSTHLIYLCINSRIWGENVPDSKNKNRTFCHHFILSFFYIFIFVSSYSPLKCNINDFLPSGTAVSLHLTWCKWIGQTSVLHNQTGLVLVAKSKMKVTNYLRFCFVYRLLSKQTSQSLSAEITSRGAGRHGVCCMRVYLCCVHVCMHQHICCIRVYMVQKQQQAR